MVTGAKFKLVGLTYGAFGVLVPTIHAVSEATGHPRVLFHIPVLFHTVFLQPECPLPPPFPQLGKVLLILEQFKGYLYLEDHVPKSLGPWVPSCFLICPVLL